MTCCEFTRCHSCRHARPFQSLRCRVQASIAAECPLPRRDFTSRTTVWCAACALPRCRALLQDAALRCNATPLCPLGGLREARRASRHGLRCVALSNADRLFDATPAEGPKPQGCRGRAPPPHPESWFNCATRRVSAAPQPATPSALLLLRALPSLPSTVEVATRGGPRRVLGKAARPLPRVRGCDLGVLHLNIVVGVVWQGLRATAPQHAALQGAQWDFGHAPQRQGATQAEHSSEVGEVLRRAQLHGVHGAAAEEDVPVRDGEASSAMAARCMAPNARFVMRAVTQMMTGL